VSAKVSLFAAILALCCSSLATYFVLEEHDFGRQEVERLPAFTAEVNGRLTEFERRLTQLVAVIEKQRSTELVETERGLGGESDESLVRKLMQLGARVENLELRATANDEDPISRGYAYLNSEDADVRKEGVKLLRRFGRRDKEIVSLLRQMLDDEDAAVRKESLEGLKDAEDYGAISQIVELLNDTDSGVREKATQVLSTLLEDPTAMNQHSAVPQSISELLVDESAKVREAAADALGKLGSVSSVPTLIDALQDPVPDVREEVVESLVKLEARSAIPALRVLYESVVAKSEHPDSLRVAAALNELGEKGPLGQEVERLVQDVTSGADADLRKRAVRTLAFLKVENQVGVFEQALKDPDPGVRKAARAALSGGFVD